MEFDINDKWINVELHPGTPPDGVTMSSLFPARTLDAMRQNLQAMGARYGIQFGKAGGLLSNTRKALQIGEFARTCGKFELFHEKVFYAYFVAGQDIGDWQVLLEINGNTVIVGAQPIEEFRKVLAK